MKDHRNLTHLQEGEHAEILGFSNQNIEIEMLKYGVKKGNAFQFLHRAPLGDPLAIIINGTKLMLRKRDAQQVLIK